MPRYRRFRRRRRRGVPKFPLWADNRNELLSNDNFRYTSPPGQKLTVCVGGINANYDVLNSFVTGNAGTTGFPTVADSQQFAYDHICKSIFDLWRECGPASGVLDENMTQSIIRTSCRVQWSFVNMCNSVLKVKLYKLRVKKTQMIAVDSSAVPLDGTQNVLTNLNSLLWTEPPVDTLPTADHAGTQQIPKVMYPGATPYMNEYLTSNYKIKPWKEAVLVPGQQFEFALIDNKRRVIDPVNWGFSESTILAIDDGFPVPVYVAANYHKATTLILMDVEAQPVYVDNTGDAGQTNTGVICLHVIQKQRDRVVTMEDYRQMHRASRYGPISLPGVTNPEIITFGAPNTGSGVVIGVDNQTV